MLGGREPPVMPLVIPSDAADGLRVSLMSLHRRLALGQATILDRAPLPTRASAAGQARRPTRRPRARPARSAASLKVGQARVTSVAGMLSGSTRELPAGTVTKAPKWSEPVKWASTSAAAALKVEWPETYSANGGVGR